MVYNREVTTRVNEETEDKVKKLYWLKVGVTPIRKEDMKALFVVTESVQLVETLKQCMCVRAKGL